MSRGNKMDFNGITRIFFSQDFSPKNKKCSEWPEMQKKHIKFFSLLNNNSPRPVRKATARAWSIWILLARAVHFLARADTPQTGPALRRSSVGISRWIGRRSQGGEA